MRIVLFTSRQVCGSYGKVVVIILLQLCITINNLLHRTALETPDISSIMLKQTLLNVLNKPDSSPGRIQEKV